MPKKKSNVCIYTSLKKRGETDLAHAFEIPEVVPHTTLSLQFLLGLTPWLKTEIKPQSNHKQRSNNNLCSFTFD